MVVEGISTAEAANVLAEKNQIDMPITKCICDVVHGELTAKEAVEYLMGREMKNEMHNIG